jgi:hypothetical protein
MRDSQAIRGCPDKTASSNVGQQASSLRKAW